MPLVEKEQTHSYQPQRNEIPYMVETIPESQRDIRNSLFVTC